VVVLNFGLAHIRRKASSPYQAPEQVKGWDGDHLSDVFSCGALLYEVLSGKSPFTGTPDEIREKIKSFPPPPLIGQPNFVRDIVQMMMAKDRLARYSKFSEVLRDLRTQHSPQPTDHKTQAPSTGRLADARQEAKPRTGPVSLEFGEDE
jgi:serine/threonine-protein kinase